MSTSSPDAIQNDNGALSSAPDSPAVLSPQSPPPNGSPDIKIDTEYLSQDSVVRRQQIDLHQVDKLDVASTQPQIGTPVDPDSIPIAPPKGTPPPPQGQLLLDVEMAEAPLPNGLGEHHMEPRVEMGQGQVNGVNGHASPSEDLNSATPRAGTPMDTTSIVASSSRPRVEADGSDNPPPAKRARTVSDADEASLAHSPSYFPPPSTEPSEAPATETARSATPSPQVARTSTLSVPQFRFCISTIRILRKLKDATPFLHPVDPVALNIPHYPSIVKHPMDFSTVDRKLASSNPAKPDPNPNNPRYLSADEFIADIRLIFSNCLLFNGPDHPVTQMGKRLEATFDKQIKNLPPPAEEPKPPAPKKLPTPTPPLPPAPVAAPTPPAASPTIAHKKARRPSTTLPIIRRSEAAETTRPKREIHPPPPKDLLYVDAPKKIRAGKKSKQSDANVEQLKYCSKILNDLHKKQHFAIASPFYEAVDYVTLKIPTYPKIVKKPMDMSLMRKKLEAKEYPNAARFREDFELMIRNCMAFNPVGNPVHNCGMELKKLFDEKWASLPPLRQMSDDEDEEDEDDEDEEEARRRAIAHIESQIEEMKGNLAALKAASKKPKKEKKEKKEKKREKQHSPPVASSSKANGKPAKQGGSSKKKSSKKALADDDTLSFDQKKDLSEAIQRLDGPKLEKVITIIHEGMPEIGDSSEEIELDIDALPAAVLTKLYNLVLKPLRSSAPKRARTGTGTGTGGLKRKSMDEDVEAEKIRKLEERMRLFDKSGGGSEWNARPAVDSEHSSDESSSDSSASDSE